MEERYEAMRYLGETVEFGSHRVERGGEYEVLLHARADGTYVASVVVGRLDAELDGVAGEVTATIAVEYADLASFSVDWGSDGD